VSGGSVVRVYKCRVSSCATFATSTCVRALALAEQAGLVCSLDALCKQRLAVDSKFKDETGERFKKVKRLELLLISLSSGSA